jgi:tetratricopeptide (TPR) repeat protein
MSSLNKGLLGRAGVAWCLVATAQLLGQSSNRTEIEQHYKRAQEALQARQDAVASREFREILRLDPRNASAHANLGVIAFTQKNYVQASQEFRVALQLQPALWNAQAFLGMSELRLGNGQEARPLLEEALRHVQDPKLRTQAGMDLIALYHESNDLGHAVDVVRALGRASPDEPAALYLAYRIYSDLAAQQLARLAQVAPESAQMHLILAQALESQDNFPGAIAQYRKALEIDPQLPGVHFGLGQMLLANSTDEPARQEAEREFKLDLAADPTNANGDYMLGEIEWLRSKPQEALEHYTHALLLRPGFVDAHIGAGKALTSLGRPDEALRHLLEAVRLDPQNEVAHYRLSQAYRKLGRLQDAERESAAFQKMRESHSPVRALYQQIQQTTVRQQTVDSNEPQ